MVSERNETAFFNKRGKAVDFGGDGREIVPVGAWPGELFQFGQSRCVFQRPVDGFVIRPGAVLRGADRDSPPSR